MIIVGDVLLSEDILEKKFACQLQKCHGACCVQGDAGAPLEPEEIEIIQHELDAIRPFLESTALQSIGQNGFYETDESCEAVTRCLPGGECVFVVYEGKTAVCGIEKAWLAGATAFRKPVSCHLYPIRAKKYGEYMVMNYHNWEICKPACAAGEELKMPVYRFLREALIRKKGEEWYGELEQVAFSWAKQKNG
jgi:hypothetical protein